MEAHNQLTSRNVSNGTNINKIEFNSEEINDTCEIAEEFNTHFTEIGETLGNKTLAISYLKPTNSTFSFKTIDVNQVKTLLGKINVNKWSGLDNIPNKLLKMAAEIVSQSLTHIFNKSLCTGIFPNDWKLARVISIHKNGAKYDLNNYRPISIISAVAKVFERIIHDQFYHY